MKMFLICPVRNAEEDISDVVAKLEEKYEVHWPPRDTNQNTINDGVDICLQNRNAIANSDVVGVWWDGKSFGSHFDLGIAFALEKPLAIVGGPAFAVVEEGKSFSKMMIKWPY